LRASLALLIFILKITLCCYIIGCYIEFFITQFLSIYPFFDVATETRRKCAEERDARDRCIAKLMALQKVD